MEMVVGNKYNWKHQSERLVYLGRAGLWNQFARVEAPTEVWCEVLNLDLHRLEETKESAK